MKGLKFLAVIVTLIITNISKAQDLSLASLNEIMPLSISETKTILRQWGWYVSLDQVEGNKRLISYENRGRILFYLYNNKSGKCLRYIYTVHKDNLDYIQGELNYKQFLRNDYEKNSNLYSSLYTDYSGRIMILSKETMSDPNYYQLMVETPNFTEELNASSGSFRSMIDFESLSSIIANKIPAKEVAKIFTEISGWDASVSNNVYIFRYQDGNYEEVLSFICSYGYVNQIIYGVPPESFGSINSEIKNGAKYLKQTTINGALCNEYYSIEKGIKVYWAVTKNKPDSFYYITIKLTQM